MLVRDAIELIRFNTSTANDLSGKSVNNILSNRALIQQLMFGLDKYAKATLAIEGIHSEPIQVNQDYIEAPPLSMHSKTYKFIVIWLDGIQYPIDIVDLARIKTNFSYQEIRGIPRWFVPWGDIISFQPVTQTAARYSTLTKDIDIDDTQINVSDGTKFIEKQGRITIGSEKIKYKYKSGNVLYDCTRGIEDTTPAAHNQNDTITENNLHIWYNKLHFRINTTDTDWVSDEIANKSLEVPTEHEEVIIDYATYRLLLKINPKRAQNYKIDFDNWLEEAKKDVRRGKSDIRKHNSIRDPYYWETPNHNPYY